MKKLHDTTYYWRVKSIDKANNESNWSNPNNFRVMTTSIVENIHTNPNSIILFSLTPNPVLDGFVKIVFSLDKTSKVNLKIYDVSGKLVRILVNADLKQGLYNYYWDRKNTNKQQVKQGVYIACLETPERKHSQKFVFVR
jgi:flagellar hook assembly protein FlgD